MLTGRRGLTLVEVMVSLVLLGLVGLATSRALRTLFGSTRAQVGLAAAQGTVRTAVLALPQEFREIGFDSVPWPGGTVTSDLESIGARRVRFRAMRGLGVTCGTPTPLEFRVRLPVLGFRRPLPTDGFLLFVDNTRGIAQDDQWVPLAVSRIDEASQCDGQPAIALTLASVPEVAPGIAMAISQHFVGGPIRWYERVEYAPLLDPASGQAFLGVRSLSLGEPGLLPVIGPMPDTASFRLEYFAGSGAALDPATARVEDVRSIGVVVTGLVPGSRLPGGVGRMGPDQVTVSGRAALRNTLRP